MRVTRPAALLAALASTMCVVLSAAQDQSAPRIRVETTDLGSMFPGRDTYPSAINNRGQIVGLATRDGDPVAFLWTREAGFQTIIENANPADINIRGDVVGTWFDCVGQPPGRSCTAKGFSWSARHGVRDLGGFFPMAVNDHGDIAGACDRNLVNTQACVIVEDVVIPAPAATPSLAMAINNRRTAAITRNWPSFGEAFLFSPEAGLTPLRAAGLAAARAINDKGMITGTRFVGDLPFAVIWNGANRTTATIPSHGAAINNRGWVVGSTVGSGGQAPMLWDPTIGIVPLGATVNNGLDHAADINDHGDIVGPVRVASGEVHVVLWRVRRTAAY